MAEPTGEITQRSPADALVVFGFTGDLACEKIFPALYAMVKKGHLAVPVIGVASSNWSVGEWHARVRNSLLHEDQQGGIDDCAAFDKLLSLMRYVSGNYNNASTFNALKAALGEATRPVFYLAIPPSLFATVIQSLDQAELAALCFSPLTQRPAHAAHAILETP
jgi:glucose-6-phosphate 1-dehydrogenase